MHRWKAAIRIRAQIKAATKISDSKVITIKLAQLRKPTLLTFSSVAETTTRNPLSKPNPVRCHKTEQKAESRKQAQKMSSRKANGIQASPP